MNADSILDILFTTPDGRIDVISNGVTPGFPIQIGQATASTPCAADINGNGKIDIIAAGDSYLWAYELNSDIIEKNWQSMHLNSSNNRYYDAEEFDF